MDALSSKLLIQSLPNAPRSAEAGFGAGTVGWGRPEVDQTADQRSQLRAAAEEFESLFLNQFLKQARETSLADGLLDSEAGKTFQGMLDTEMTRSSAGRMHIGLADAMVKQLGKSLPKSGL